LFRVLSAQSLGFSTGIPLYKRFPVTSH
jgi:hypothetical protein